MHSASIDNPISVMLSEHDTVGDLLRQLRSLTHSYTPPADGCGSYVALFAGFETMEADTHPHIHKENNLLFPAVVERWLELFTTTLDDEQHESIDIDGAALDLRR